MTAEERSSKKVDSNTDLNSMVYTEKKKRTNQRSRTFGRTFEQAEQQKICCDTVHTKQRGKLSILSLRKKVIDTILIKR